MTPIARFNLAYWLAKQFVDEVIRTTGHPPYWSGPATEALGLSGAVNAEELARFVEQGITPNGVTRRMLTVNHPGLEVVVSPDKSLTLARVNVSEDRAREVRKLLDNIVAEEFGRLKVYARTGAGGRDRVEAQPVVAVAPQGVNKAGEVHDHWHVFVSSVGYVPGQQKLLSIDQPRFFHDVQLVRDRINNRFAEVFRNELGVRTELEGKTLRCPDVPKDCVRATSTRKEQIEQHLASQGIRSTKASRKIAAHVTREQNPNVEPSATLFADTRRLCERHGFDHSKVYGRERPRTAGDVETYRLVQKAAVDLAKAQGLFSRLEHEALCHQRAVNANVRPGDVDRMIDRQHKNSFVNGIYSMPGNMCTMSHSKAAWDRFANVARNIKRPDLTALTRPLTEGAHVAAALGRKATKALQGVLTELLLQKRFDIERVHDLRRYLEKVTPTSRWRAHARALKAAFKPGLGGINARLRYAEHVYRQNRHPDKIMTRRTLIIVRNTSQERVDDLVRLIKLADKHGSKVIFTDRRKPTGPMNAAVSPLWPQQFDGTQKTAPEQKHQHHRRYH